MNTKQIFEQMKQQENLVFQLWENKKEGFNPEHIENLKTLIPSIYEISQRPFFIKCKGDDGEIHFNISCTKTRAGMRYYLI
jgi:hypothetical protein